RGQRFEHLDAHAAPEPGRSDDRRRAVEVRDEVRHFAGDEDAPSREAFDGGRRRGTDDVQRRLRPLLPDPRKYLAREADSRVDVRLVAEASEEEEIAGIRPERIPRALRNVDREWDRDELRQPDDGRQRGAIALGEDDDRVYRARSCRFETTPGAELEPSLDQTDGVTSSLAGGRDPRLVLDQHLRRT